MPVLAISASRIALEVEDRRFAVDAALWLPAGHGPAPLIVGLDFLGPIGVLEDASFPLDLAARIDYRGSTVLDATLRGRDADRWPLGLIRAAGFGLLLSCYGSWVPDDPAAWRDHGLVPLLRSPPETGAIALWAWALARLVDAALTLPEVDATRIHLARPLAPRQGGTLGRRRGRARRRRHRQQQRLRRCRPVAPPGRRDAGAADRALPALADAVARRRSRSGGPAGRPAPAPRLHRPAPPLRRLGVGGPLGRPEGEYLALAAAAPAWNLALPPLAEVWRPGAELRAAALAWHLRDGGHDLTPWDWAAIDLRSRRARCRRDRRHGERPRGPPTGPATLVVGSCCRRPSGRPGRAPGRRRRTAGPVPPRRTARNRRP